MFARSGFWKGEWYRLPGNLNFIPLDRARGKRLLIRILSSLAMHSPRSLERFHKLDVSEIVGKIETHQFGAIQLDTPGVTRKRPNQRIPDEVLEAVNQYYVVGYDDAKCVVYVPKAAQ
jgi:hypothetical protein